MKITALAGGVGGAKLVDGLAQVLPADDLTVIVNTGDDFEHLGLYICPDLDTVCYTLGGLANPETGWGRENETFHALENMETLGVENWFHLGDKDLATHLERTRRMREGQKLSRITRDFCRAWGVHPAILPMSDYPVHTMVDTLEYGEVGFQEYFVRRQCKPQVRRFRFQGIESALPATGVEDALQQADAVIFCPSNPWVSIDPILAIAGVKKLIATKPAVAVTPIIGGKTVKGPAAKMFTEMGIQPSASAIAGHFKEILSGFVLDQVDKELEAEIQSMDMRTLVINTLMRSTADRRRLAEDVLHFVKRL